MRQRSNTNQNAICVIAGLGRPGKLPVLGHHCLFSRSGNLPFLKPTLIERYANGARCWCGPLGSSGASQPPRRSPQRRAEGSTFPPKKINVYQEPYEPLCVARQGAGILHNPKFRILPPTSRHLPSPLDDRFLGRGGESIDCDRPGLHGRADEIEADSTMAMPTMTAPSASPDRETNQT